jgi:hypothetical protein
MFHFAGKNFFSAYSTVLFCLASLMLSCSGYSPDIISAPKDVSHNARGKHLVKGLAACGHCHGELQQSTESNEPLRRSALQNRDLHLQALNYRNPSALLVGGLKQYDRYGEVTAPNITPAKSGIGEWSEAQLLTFFRTGETPDNRNFSPEVHKGYEWLSDEDLVSIVSYIRNLPKVEKENQKRSVSFVKRNTIGFFEGSLSVSGAVPEVEKTKTVVYGAYLVDHVARCWHCHNSPSGVIQNEQFLKGGKNIKNEKGDKLAPDITQSQVYGIGSWSDDDMRRFFKLGVSPDGKKIDPDFCPVAFYSESSKEEIEAIIAFLRTVK